MDSNSTPDEPIILASATSTRLFSLINNERKLLVDGNINLLKKYSNYSI